MFYSHGLLSRKGSLGAIWVAAHCSKKLKKSQITQTDISSSVENILQAEFGEVSYRMLAHLLLGLVKIYSKKVEFLFHDCNEVLLMMKNFVVTPKVDSFKRTISTSYFSITIPKTLELDAFDLEIVGDTFCENVALAEEITLKDELLRSLVRHRSVNKDASDVFNTLHAFHSELTFNDNGQLNFNEDCYFDRDDTCLPGDHDCQTEGQTLNDTKDSNFSDLEKFHNVTFLRSEAEMFDVIHEICYQNNSGYQDNIEGSPGNVSLQSQNIPEDGLCQTAHFSEDANANIKVPEISEATTSDYLATPSLKERTPPSRKRKCKLDYVTVLSNRILKQQIEDASDLVRKRRKCMIRSAISGRFLRTLNFQELFSEPLILYKTSKLGSLFDLKKAVMEAVGQVNSLGVLLSECSTSTDSQIQDSRGRKIGALKEEDMMPCREAEQPVEKLLLRPTTSSPPIRELLLISNATERPTHSGKYDAIALDEPLFEEPLIAPETPVLRMKSRKTISSPDDPDNDTQGTPLGCLDDDHELFARDDDFCFRSEELQSFEEEKLSAVWSRKTRSVVRYLNGFFINAKENTARNAIKLSLHLDGKSRKESAIFFHEILVLNTIGLIRVKQKEAYGDILVQKCDQWDNMDS